MAEESFASAHSNGSPLPNVNERLAKLRPSKELLEYYRRKIAEFDNEHQEMLGKLEKYRCTYEEQVCNYKSRPISVSFVLIIFQDFYGTEHHEFC